MKGSILLIDDEEDLLEILVRVLKPLGAEIYTATNGKQALEIISTGKIDVVLSDINMPIMNGLELLAILRSRGNEIPFIFLTGNADLDKAIEAMRLGAIDLLTKPFGREVLLQKMSKALEYGLALKEIELEIAEFYEEKNLTFEKRSELLGIKRSIRMMSKQTQIYIN